MDSEYRRALKEHFKKSFKTNQIQFKKQEKKNPAIDFVESLLPPKKAPPISQTVDALLDGSYTSTLNLIKRNQKSDAEKSNLTGFTDTHTDESYASALITARRENGGEDIIIPKRFSGSTQTVYSRASTSRTNSTTFRPRTSRDLLCMVRGQCRIVESQYRLSGSSASHCIQSPKVLWKSRRKFGSSEEMRSVSGVSSVSNLRLLNERVVASNSNPTPSRHSTEKLVRDQFTAPLTREIERIYLQNILTTADLLKKLDNMPSAIVDALDKFQH